MLKQSRGLFSRARARQTSDGERGQILVLFTLAIILLMVLAAVVIDIGLLRTDGARLQNALDSGALAAGQSLPANNANYAAVRATAVRFTQDNYPGVAAPATEFACLIGVSTSTGLPRVTDMPRVCNVSLAANDARWRCTGAACWAPCDPSVNATDVCNTINVLDSATRQYTFGRTVGVNSRDTGTLSAAACTGACGQPPTVPVDVVVILDRTGSMDQSDSVANLRTGARAVLQAFTPDIQRVALGFTGPTSLYRVAGGDYGSSPSSQPTNSCTSPNTIHALSLDPGRQAPGPVPTVQGTPTWAVNASPPPASNNALLIQKPVGTANGSFLLATIVVDGGANTTITPPSGWTLVRRTNNGNDVGVATYRRFAGALEGPDYTFGITNGIRAVGGIVRYSGVYTSSPIDTSGPTNNPTNPSSRTLTAASISPGSENTALVAVYGSDTGTTFETMATGFTERIDRRHADVNGPTIGVGTSSQSSSGSTGSKVATTAGPPEPSGRWVAQLVALRGVPGATDVYGTNVMTDMPQWIPIGFTGTDTDSPPVVYNEAYVNSAGNPVSGTHIVQAIGCFDVSSTGTNLARPLYMAKQYLQAYGRPGVKQGIILETDGAPNNGGYGPSSDYTSSGVLAAAQSVKDAGIELFTIGYGVDNTTVQLLGNMASDKVNPTDCTTRENGDGDHFFCQPLGSDLATVLQAAAIQLAGGTRLIQLYPQPIITSIGPSTGPAAGGTSVTITGKYFTEAYSVTFGGTPASFSVVSDTSITAVSPAGAATSTVHIQVSTPGGSSKLVNADRFTYGP